jgi:predicted nucleotidyltransferase
MISILKRGQWKIMELFYNDKSARLHLREIARKAKLHEPSTTRFLKALEKDGILTSEMDGNQKKYSIKLNYKTYAAFQLFDLEKLNELPHIRRNAINYFFDALKEKPIIAFVFGSTAKGTFKANSDIDMLIITNSKTNTTEAEKHAESLTGIRISVFQMNLEAFLKEIKLKEDPVIQAAIASGYPVLNNMYYYEVLYNGHQIP